MDNEKKVYEILNKVFSSRMNKREINLKTEFKDLDMESLEYLTLVIYLEQEFDFNMKNLLVDEEVIFSCGQDVLDYLERVCNESIKG